MLGLFNAAAADERIQKAADRDATNLNGVLRIVRPVCCYVGDKTAKAIVSMALHGKVYGKDE